MKKVRIPLLCCCFVTVQAHDIVRASPWQSVATVNICVHDESNAPIIGAHVMVSYAGPGIDTVTDTNGVVSYADTVTGSLACEVLKAGHYRTYGELWRGPVYGEEAPPTNLYAVLLKRVIDPKPMIEQRVNKPIPRFDTDLGFDLELGDWVAPFGRGRVSDMIVRARFRDDGERDYEKEMRISFPGGANGIQPHDGPNKLRLPVASVLPVPQVAPLQGYANAWMATRSRKPKEPPVSNMKETDRQYLFRVRAQTNDAGEVVSANYGWVLGDFELRGPSIDLQMWYYFNPDPQSRSLEPASLSKKREHE